MVINSTPQAELPADAINPILAVVTWCLWAQIYTWRQETALLPQQRGLPGSSQGLVPEAEGKHRSSLNQLDPLQTCQEMEMSSSAPGVIPLPEPRRAPSWEQRCSWPCKGLGRAPGRAKGLTQECTTIFTICRGNGSW